MFGDCMKKLIVIVAILLTLTACQSENHNKTRIAMLISSLDNPFFIEISKYAEYEANENNLELIILDSENDVQKEFDNFMALENVDAIIINPVDTQGSADLVRIANKQKIPLISLDRQVKGGQVVSHVESDNYKGGVLAAELLSRVVKGTSRILVLEGIEGTTANTQRLDGFNDTVDKLGLEVTRYLTANFSRQAAYDLMMTDGNLSTFDIVFCANDEMALGVLDASLEKDDYKLIIGFDGTMEAAKAVKRGFMVGTIAQQPDLLAKVSIKTIKDHLTSKDVLDRQKIKLKTISNVAK